LKRAGLAKRVAHSSTFDFDNLPDAASVRDLEMIDIDDALDALKQMDSRKARVIELRFFGGLSVEETAAALNVSPQTVMRDWKLARAWMMRELRKS
jgi:RNA polymerase sigma factor (TIGR02999 family)